MSTPRTSDAATAAVTSAAPGSWAPLAEPLFRTLWIASLLANTGQWTQDMAASWLMTSATDAPLLVSLMQGAASLPYLLFAFPAGVLADSLNQRTMLVSAAFFIALVSATMAGLSAALPVAPWMLLVYVFAMGAGGAFYDPVWKGVVPQLVRPGLQASAFGLDGVSVNLARALGPAVAGVLIGLYSPSLAMAFNAVAFVLLGLLLLRWTPAARTARPLTRAAFVSSLRTGVQFARFSPPVQRILGRSALFLLPASAMWALMPLVGRRVMGLGSSGYGLLVGCAGIGAIVVIGLMPRLKAALGTERAMQLGSAAFLVNLAALAWSAGVAPSYALLCVTMALAGAGWILVLSNLQASLLPATPTWVRGRVIALYSLTFFGSVSCGSFAWGLVAQLSSPQAALVVAGAVLALSIAASLRLPLPLPVTGDGDAAPVGWAALPGAVPAFSEGLSLGDGSGSGDGQERDGVDGPIVVYNDYQVDGAQRSAFLAQVLALGDIRRKNGAYQWGIFQDLENPALQKERFMVSSRAEYLAQNERLSPADLAALAALHALTRSGQAPAQRYFRLEAIN